MSVPPAQPLNEILDLYRRSFPQSERRGDDAIAASIASPNYRTITKYIDGKLAGFALLFVPADESFSLLEYLAVEPAFQGCGVGSQLVRNAIAAAGDRAVLFEVEAESVGSAAVRRQQFYRRLGCRRIDGLNYLLPLPGNQPPMQLMIRTLDAQLAINELPLWIRRIYMNIYGCGGADPRITKMLRQLLESVAISE